MTTEAPTLKLSERAAQEVKTIMAENEFDPAKDFLRVGVRGGGCSGFNYTIDLSESKKDTDEVFPQHGVNLICDPKSLLYLSGTEIGYKDELMGQGFTFNNPNATSTCGCKSSFSV